MAKSTIISNKWLMGLAGSVLFTAMSSSAFAMSPFQAEYHFSYNGKELGSASRVLTQQGNQWVYTFAAKAGGGIASATETSHFTFKQGKISSESFSRSSKIFFHENSMGIQFDPNHKQINTHRDERKWSFDWVPNVLDELNAELQVREDLKATGRMKATYPLADAKHVENRKFVKQGNEKIETDFGTFETIKVRLLSDDPERSTIFWLAPKLDYLPVKVAHQDEGKTYGLSLIHYSGKSEN